MKDQDLLEALKSPFSRGNAIKMLYKEYPKIKALILSSGGSKEEAEEIFNDALLLLIEKVITPDFELTSKLTTFFYGINRFLWINMLRKNKKQHTLEWQDTIIVTAEDMGYDEAKEAKLNTIEEALELISKKCQEIFRRFYYRKEKMTAIATTMGYSSVNSAKTQKYKCMEQLQKTVNANYQKA